MAHLKWTKDLDTGIDVIDQQHRKIVDYINTLYDASLTKDRAQIKQVLNDLVEYTISHFAFEEEMQAEAGYTFVKAHQKVHQLFVRRVGEFIERFDNGEDITEPLLALLRNWLINHIKRDDADYVSSVKTNILKIDPNPKKSWWKRLFS